MLRKIAVITGSRAEYGLLKPVLNEIITKKTLKLELIVTGMHLSKKYGYSIQNIINDGFKIDHKFAMIPKNNTHYGMLNALSIGIKEFGKLFQKIHPDIILVLGDRDEVFAATISASHLNIPIAHIHGGERTKAGIDEYNRHAITKISNIHFAATKKSYERIIRLGENPKFVFNTGSPGIDDIKNKNFSSKKQLEKKYGFKFSGNDALLVFHPVTNDLKNNYILIKQILKIIKKFKISTIAISPNSDTGNYEINNELKKFSKINNNFKLFKNIPRYDYLGFLNNCLVLIGNSSSGMIEAGYFDIIVINIGFRQDKREHGKNVITIKNSGNQIEKEIKKCFLKKITFSKSNVYGNGNSSKKIVQVLERIPLNNKLIQKQIVY